MIPDINGAHLWTNLALGRSDLLNPAASLSCDLNWAVRAAGFDTTAGSVSAFEAWRERLATRTAGTWHIEIAYPAHYLSPRYANLPGDGNIAWLAASPRLNDPSDLNERIAAYEVLSTALDEPATATTLLPLVDWAVRPLLRAWNQESEHEQTRLSATRMIVEYPVAMSGHWRLVRRVRRELLAPWFAGARQTRKPRFFAELHDQLSDELAYFTSRVASGNSELFNIGDPAVAQILAEAEERRLIAPRYGGGLGGPSNYFARSRHVALSVASDEVLIAV